MLDEIMFPMLFVHNLCYLQPQNKAMEYYPEKVLLTDILSLTTLSCPKTLSSDLISTFM